MQDLQKVREQKRSKGLARGLALILFGGALFLLSSCSSYNNWGGYGASYGGDYRSAEPWYDIGRSYTPRRTGSVCSRCRYNPCRCRSDHGARYGYLNSGYGYGSYYGGRGYRDHRDHDDHDHKKSSSSKKKKSSKDEKYKLTGGNVGRGHPKNYHTLDWYKGRGYNVKDFILKNQDGKTHKSGSSSHKKNKSSKKHSSSSKKSGSSSSKKSSSKKSSSKKSNSSKGKSQKLKGAKNRA